MFEFGPAGKFRQKWTSWMASYDLQGAMSTDSYIYIDLIKGPLLRTSHVDPQHTA